MGYNYVADMIQSRCWLRILRKSR